MPSASLRDPERDLVLERVVPIPPRSVWRAWTEPELLKKWFTPAPWKTTDCEMELRPGGIFRTVMQGPEGQRVEGAGCFLEVVPDQRLVWTSALGPGFRPNAGDPSGISFTAIIALAPEGGGTRYTATALHPTAASCKAHADMGFEQGWGAALEQLVALMRSAA